MRNSVCELKNTCTGCGACTLVCPVGALSVKKSDEGFFTAVIDEKKCISCGKCVNVCLKNGAAGAKKLSEGEALAAQSKNKAVAGTCSSGGIAYEMSKFAVNNNYVVAGFVYETSDNTVKAVLADTEDGILPFKGSKYLQGKCDEAFGQALEIAKNDKEKRFLVFGTPCQIYGFACTLEELKIRDRFILVDLFCHGVPSYLVWEAYLSSIRSETGENIKSVVFRDKSIGWHNYVLYVYGEKGESKKSSEGNLFYEAFFDNVLLGEACLDCEVRKNVSKADIRLGDFWGSRFKGREDGVSAVLCLSKAGKSFIDKVADISVITEAGADEVLAGQSTRTYERAKKLHKEAIDNLKRTNNLKKTINGYRKKFPAKTRIKLILKRCTTIIPKGMRIKLKRIYKRTK